MRRGEARLPSLEDDPDLAASFTARARDVMRQPASLAVEEMAGGRRRAPGRRFS